MNYYYEYVYLDKRIQEEKKEEKFLVINCTHNALGSILQTKSLYMPREKHSTNLQIV